MASGDTLIIFTALHNEPPASNYATLDLRNQHPILNFDDTTSESAVFTGIMPSHYAGGGVEVKIHWSAVATSGDVDWDAAFERIGDQQLDVDADDFAAVNSADDNAVPGTSGLVDIVSISFSDGEDMDSVAAGELFRIKITRDVADTASGDVELHAVEIIEA